MDIETKNANLDTLAVTIQALHVNGKQMTLAVFRQLPINHAYDIDGTINDSLQHWGLVRYPIKDEGELWLVASDKSKLFRCSVGYRWETVERAKRNVEQRRRDLNETLRYEKEMEAVNFYQKLKNEAEAKRSFSSYAEKDAWLKDTIGPEPKYASRPQWEHHLGIGNEKYTPSSEVRKWLMDADHDLLCSLNAEASRKEIEQLTQLFIAV